MMNLIYQKSGVKYNEVHVYRLLHRWDLFQRLQQKDLKIQLVLRKNSGLKKLQRTNSLKNSREGFTVLAQDESIFTADALFRKKMCGR